MEERKDVKQVSALKDGTVIDHIPAKNLFKVINILGLDHIHSPITFGTNLESKKLNKKAIIKIAEKFFKDEEINRIALIAPTAKLNIIKNYIVVEKRKVEVPEYIEGILKCINPKCITNNDMVKTKFDVISRNDVALKCRYCEKITDQDHFELV